MAVVAASVLIGTAAQADEKFTPQDKTFVMKVSQGNNAEIMTSKLALQKSQDKNVRKVADMLVKEHGQAEDNLKQLASTYKMKVPDGTDPKHQAMYKMLQGINGTAFDKAYMKGQVKDHYATIALFKKELDKGNQTQVRSYAVKWLPGIENHTQMITSVASNMGIKTATKTGMTPAQNGAHGQNGRDAFRRARHSFRRPRNHARHSSGHPIGNPS